VSSAWGKCMVLAEEFDLPGESRRGSGCYKVFYYVLSVLHCARTTSQNEASDHPIAHIIRFFPPSTGISAPAPGGGESYLAS